jgi:hypothetical protein
VQDPERGMPHDQARIRRDGRRKPTRRVVALGEKREGRRVEDSHGNTARRRDGGAPDVILHVRILQAGAVERRASITRRSLFAGTPLALRSLRPVRGE